MITKRDFGTRVGSTEDGRDMVVRVSLQVDAKRIVTEAEQAKSWPGMLDAIREKLVADCMNTIYGDIAERLQKLRRKVLSKIVVGEDFYAVNAAFAELAGMLEGVEPSPAVGVVENGCSVQMKREE